MKNKRFEGWYFKHQVGDKTVAIIPGSASGQAFIQVITNQRSYHFDLPDLQVERPMKLQLGGCSFSEKGLTLDLPGITGTLTYGPLTQLNSDIMGPFHLLPMQCRHGVISMSHSVSGCLEIGSETLCFDGGKGYIEKDSGNSFPREYLWIHSNDFDQACSVMVSIAHIPFAGFAFTGCICAVVFGGQEYRLATYHGVKIIKNQPNRLILRQGPYRLQIDVVQNTPGHSLKSPKKGEMTGLVRECNGTTARFRFYENHIPLFDLTSHNTSYEKMEEHPAP